MMFSFGWYCRCFAVAAHSDLNVEFGRLLLVTLAGLYWRAGVFAGCMRRRVALLRHIREERPWSGIYGRGEKTSGVSERDAI